MNDDNIRPAVLANMNSIKYAMAGDKTRWLALYADDAVVRDPVGQSPLDEAGAGYRGKAAVEQFWDTVIGPANLTITAHRRYPSGDQACAVTMTIANDMGNGITTSVDMVAVYEVDDEGLIVSMSAYWDWLDMERQLKDLGLM